MQFPLMSLMKYKTADFYGVPVVEITEKPYEGTIISVGNVQLVPDEEQDRMKVKFDLAILEGDVLLETSDNFKYCVANIILDIIEADMNQNNLAFCGGVNEV